MTEEPVVSIIIPTYNRAGYLRESLRSALDQTYDNIQVVVLDDASTDSTKDVVESFSSDSRLCYIRHENNLGLVGNWRAGIAAAEGEYFCFLGDDDTLEPHFVKRLVRPLVEDSSSSLSFSDHWIMDGQGVRLTDLTEANTLRWMRHRLTEGHVPDFARTALIDRSLFIGAVLFRGREVEPSFLHEEVTAFIDVWLYYKCLKGGGKAAYVPDRLVNCRWQTGGVSRSWKWRIYGLQGEIYCLRKFMEDSDLVHLRPLFLEWLNDALVTYGNTLLTLGEHAKARSALHEALSIKKSTRALVGALLARMGPVGRLGAGWLRSLRSSAYRVMDRDPSLGPVATRRETEEDSAVIYGPARAAVAAEEQTHK